MDKLPPPIILMRGEDRVEVSPETWAKILNFLGQLGWKPSVPTHWFLAPKFDVSQEDAKSLAAAGRIVQEETVKDPLSAYNVIEFDMGKLAEVVCFCEEGAFKICR